MTALPGAFALAGASLVPIPGYHDAMVETPIVIEPDPVVDVFKKDIDRTLLEENLKLSPEDRLRKLHTALRGAAALREAYLKSRQ